MKANFRKVVPVVFIGLGAVLTLLWTVFLVWLMLLFLIR